MKNIWMSPPLTLSALLHLALALIIGGGGFLLNRFSKKTDRRPPVSVSVVVKEVPAAAQVAAPVVDVRKPPTPKAPQNQARKVFGLRTQSLTSESADAGVGVKEGNTLATTTDREVLKPEDEGALPVPTEEYLVTAMPRPLNEFRIPYPPEARAKNIEGVVVMDLLIDEKGRVREVVLLEGPGFGLNEAALKAIKQFKFSPALLDKQPVAVRMRYGYRFVLN